MLARDTVNELLIHYLPPNQLLYPVIILCMSLTLLLAAHWTLTAGRDPVGTSTKVVPRSPGVHSD